MDAVATASRPNELEATLAGNARARERFEKLSPGHQRVYIEWIGEAKKPETRKRRAQKAIEMLLTGTANRTAGPAPRGVDSEAR